MIDYISGKVAELTPTRVVVDNNGLGYGLEISLQTYAALENVENAKIFVQSQPNPRDGSVVDYGFADKLERDFFRLITGVSGIGAASARMILSSLSAEELRDAILSENVIAIKSVKGIGVKSAQRLILELKDKIVKGEGEENISVFTGADNAGVEEATSALVMLGFARPAISKAVQSIVKSNPGAKVEEIIKSALKML